jgi:hypothetical protein
MIYLHTKYYVPEKESLGMVSRSLCISCLLIGLFALSFEATQAQGVDFTYITTKPNNQQGILYTVNVTAYYNNTKITSSISNMSGVVTLRNIPIGNVTFIAYAKSDHSQVIANNTVNITLEGQRFDLVCDQNYTNVSNNWKMIITPLSLSLLTVLPFLLFSFHIKLKKHDKGTKASLTSQWKLVYSASEKERR